MGPFTVLNDNAGWCWFQGPRVIFDAPHETLVCGTVATRDGEGGETRNGNIEVASCGLAGSGASVAALGNILLRGRGDDHNAPALWQRPDGRFLAVYTGHNFGAGNGHGPDGTVDSEPLTFYRISSRPHDATEWEPQQIFAWPADDPVGTDRISVTYSNLHYLTGQGGDKGRLYNIARAAGHVWQIATSDDWGESWTYRGTITLPPAGGRDYSNGYMKFSDNGVDRIDFITTEAHPRDYNNGIYHGYIQGGQTFNSAGEVIDPDTFSREAPHPEACAPLFTPGAVAPDSYHHAWTAELRRGDDGELFALFTTRFGTGRSDVRWPAPGDNDHRLFFGRFDGSSWSTSELAPMGEGLNWYQEDYTGLGSVDPRDGRTVYVSTPIDPRTGARLPHHEIFRAQRGRHGGVWHWSSFTSNSTTDNLRPQLLPLDNDRVMLLWLHGSYDHPHEFRQALVARPCE